VGLLDVGSIHLQMHVLQLGFVANTLALQARIFVSQTVMPMLQLLKLVGEVLSGVGQQLEECRMSRTCKQKFSCASESECAQDAFTLSAHYRRTLSPYADPAKLKSVSLEGEGSRNEREE
jgi:glucose-6-phosphate dehydrogenase assembly protein OpcA